MLQIQQQQQQQQWEPFAIEFSGLYGSVSNLSNYKCLDCISVYITWKSECLSATNNLRASLPACGWTLLFLPIIDVKQQVQCEFCSQIHIYVRHIFFLATKEDVKNYSF